MNLKEYERGPVTPPEPVGPTPAEQAREREEQLQAQVREQELEAARAKAKVEAMEQFVREQYAAGRQNQAPPDNAVRAQEELGLTDEEILNDPTAAIAKLSAHIRRQEEQMAEYQRRSNQVIGSLAKNNFKSEMQSLSKERYAEWLTPYVEDYFRRNPEDAFKEGAVRRVYNELVGQNIEELDRLYREKTMVPGQRERVIEPPTRFASSPEPRREESRSKLSEEEAFFLAEMNRRNPKQYEMSEDEWLEIRSGKKYPKKISTDIQVRGAKPNVSY